jgi:hypothetical protein
MNRNCRRNISSTQQLSGMLEADREGQIANLERNISTKQ